MEDLTKSQILQSLTNNIPSKEEIEANYKKLLIKGYFNNNKKFEEHFSDLVKKRYLRYFMIQCCYNPASKFRRNKLEQVYDEFYS